MDYYRVSTFSRLASLVDLDFYGVVKLFSGNIDRG